MRRLFPDWGPKSQFLGTGYLSPQTKPITSHPSWLLSNWAGAFHGISVSSLCYFKSQSFPFLWNKGKTFIVKAKDLTCRFQLHATTCFLKKRIAGDERDVHDTLDKISNRCVCAPSFTESSTQQYWLQNKLYNFVLWHWRCIFKAGNLEETEMLLQLGSNQPFSWVILNSTSRA